MTIKKITNKKTIQQIQTEAQIAYDVIDKNSDLSQDIRARLEILEKILGLNK